MRSATRLAALTLALSWALAAPSARAEFFEYTSTVTIDDTAGSFTPTGSTIVNGASSSSIATPGGNQVILTAQDSNPAVPHQNAQGVGTDIVPISINANSSFPSEAIGFNFSLSVTITDYASASAATPTGAPVTFTFTGRIGGQIGDFQTNLDLLSFAPMASSQLVGGAVYTVGLNTPGGFASPGLDGNGALTLHVTSRAVPEPGSLTLLGMGGALGMFLRRRIRASA